MEQKKVGTGKRAEYTFTKWVYRNSERCLYLVFALVVLVEALFFSFLLPLGQVPDEPSHYEQMGFAFGAPEFAHQMIQEVYNAGHFCDLPRNAETKVKAEAVNSVKDLHFGYRPGLNDLHLNLNAIKYLPAGVGFYLGAMLGLPMLTCTYLAELFSVLFFVVISCLIIRIAPIKKEIFAFCLLIPECLQQCASVNYDAVLIPCSMLLFAYVLRLYYSERKIGWKALIPVAGLSFVITLIKPPYLLICGTVLILPFSRYELKIGKRFDVALFVRKHRYFALLTVVLSVGAITFLLRDRESIKTILADIIYPLDFLKLLYRTFLVEGYTNFVQMVGIFGWLDSRVNDVFVVTFVIMLTYMNCSRVERVNNEIGTIRRCVLSAVAIATLLLVDISAQIWTNRYLQLDMAAPLCEYRNFISELPSITGVQGRYWIPCLPIILIALSGKTERRHVGRYFLIQAIYYLISFMSVYRILNNRYW